MLRKHSSNESNQIPWSTCAYPCCMIMFSTNLFFLLSNLTLFLRNSPNSSELSGILSNGREKSEFISVVGRTKTTGPNYEHIKGPNDSLLLWVFYYHSWHFLLTRYPNRADYITWNGANPEIVASRKSLAVGADSANRLPKKSTVNGSNAANCKGANKKLIKGSMYSNIRCN